MIGRGEDGLNLSVDEPESKLNLLICNLFSLIAVKNFYKLRKRTHKLHYSFI